MLDSMPTSTLSNSESSSHTLSSNSSGYISYPKTPLSPESKFKELSPSPNSQTSSASLSGSHSPHAQPPRHLPQELGSTPPKSSREPFLSNPDIGTLEVLTSLLSMAKHNLEAQTTSHIHSPPAQRPSRPPPIGVAVPLQSDHILHEKWCDRCLESFYGVQCESHVSVYSSGQPQDNGVQADLAPSLPLDSNDKPNLQDPDTGSPACSPNDVLQCPSPSVIIQQFGTSGSPPTCTIDIILKSQPSADHCSHFSSPSSSNHASASIIIKGPPIFEGDSKFYNGHVHKINRCHCQVSLLRSNSSSSWPHSTVDSDDDRLSCGCAGHQLSRSPSPSRGRSNCKLRVKMPARTTSSSPPKAVYIPPSPLSPRFISEPAWLRSAKYYFEDGTVVFRVGMMLYKVHRHFFDRYSIFFHDLFTTINLDARDINDPIFLAEIEPRDFECLLSVFYPRSFDKSDLSTADWTSILSLSTRWSFTDIRQSAVNHLAPNSITTPIDKIVLGTKYGVGEWLAPAYEEVCLRGRALDLEEGARLSSERVAKIYKLRMEFGLESGMRMASEGEPCGGGEARARVPTDAPARIRQAFGLGLI